MTITLTGRLFRIPEPLISTIATQANLPATNPNQVADRLATQFNVVTRATQVTTPGENPTVEQVIWVLMPRHLTEPHRVFLALIAPCTADTSMLPNWTDEPDPFAVPCGGYRIANGQVVTYTVAPTTPRL